MKKRTHILTGILLTLLATGCASNNNFRKDIAPNDRSLTDEVLCIKYQEMKSYNIAAPNIKKVLTDNHKVEPKHWRTIDRGEVETGMTQLETICALGEPTSFEFHPDRTVQGYEDFHQRIKVTFIDGKVTKWKYSF